MSQADPWAKIWWDWYVSRSHIGLSGVALALGAPLMLIGRECARRHSDANGYAWRDAKGDEHQASPDFVWFRHKNGRPYTAADLAGIVRFDVVAVQAALDELLGEETLVLRDDGCYGMPRFWKYQETSAAARMRKHRENTARNSYASGDGKSDGQKREERREKTDALASLVRGTRAEGTAGEEGDDLGADEAEDDGHGPEPLGSAADVDRPPVLVRKAFTARHIAATDHPPSWDHKNVRAAKVIGEWLDEGVRSAREFEAKLKRLLDNFFGDQWVIEQGYPIGDLASRTARYFDPPKPQRDVRKGFVAPAPASAFTSPTDLDKVFGPEQPPQPAAGGMRR